MAQSPSSRNEILAVKTPDSRKCAASSWENRGTHVSGSQTTVRFARVVSEFEGLGRAGRGDVRRGAHLLVCNYAATKCRTSAKWDIAKLLVVCFERGEQVWILIVGRDTIEERAACSEVFEMIDGLHLLVLETQLLTVPAVLLRPPE
jgi:hypothetical protein